MSPRRRTVSPLFAPIQTQRLELRPFRAGDLAQLQRIVSTLNARGGVPSEPRALTAAARAQRGQRPAGTGDYEFAVVVRRTGRLAGACELVMGPRKSGEIGYLLGPRHWGRGYATELTRALVAFGFDGLSLRSVHAVVALDNPRSRRVLEKAGFVWDALLRRASRSAGPAMDAERYIRHAEPA